MKRWILGLVTVAAISLIGGATASAQGYGCGGYGGYGGYGGGYGGYGYTAGYGGYTSPGYGGYTSPGYGGYGGWHNTSHFDYHPGSYQRHRLHSHYVPGHNDYHRSGHRH